MEAGISLAQILSKIGRTAASDLGDDGQRLIVITIGPEAFCPA
jgi:hypothetical protein